MTEAERSYIESLELHAGRDSVQQHDIYYPGHEPSLLDDFLGNDHALLGVEGARAVQAVVFAEAVAETSDRGEPPLATNHQRQQCHLRIKLLIFLSATRDRSTNRQCATLVCFIFSPGYI